MCPFVCVVLKRTTTAHVSARCTVVANMDINSFVSPGVGITRSQHTHDDVGGGRVIQLRDVESCPCPDELRNSLEKRLRSRNLSASTLDLGTVAMWCIGSVMYCVNSSTITGVNDENMLKVWSVLERMQVASSPRLCLWVRQVLAGRSRDGYAASLEYTPVAQTPRHASVEISWSTQWQHVDPRRISALVGGSETLIDSISRDAELLCIMRHVNRLPPPRLLRDSGQK